MWSRLTFVRRELYRKCYTARIYKHYSETLSPVAGGAGSGAGCCSAAIGGPATVGDAPRGSAITGEANRAAVAGALPTPRRGRR